MQISYACRLVCNGIEPICRSCLFIISGYFFYGSYTRNDYTKAKRSALHILKLSLIAIAVYFIWKYIEPLFTENPLADIKDYILSYLSIKNGILFSVFNMPTNIREHIWFLLALLYVYIIMIICTKIRLSRKILYASSIALIALSFVLNYALDICGISIFRENYYLTRNWLMSGLPMFSIGMLMREKEDRILSVKISKWAIIAALGFAITLVEAFVLGKFDLYLGSLASAISLIAISIHCSNVKINIKRPEILEKISLLIYIIHPMISSMTSDLFDKAYMTSANCLYCWAKPIIVLLISLLLSYVFLCAGFAIKGKAGN